MMIEATDMAGRVPPLLSLGLHWALQACSLGGALYGVAWGEGAALGWLGARARVGLVFTGLSFALS